MGDSAPEPQRRYVTMTVRGLAVDPGSKQPVLLLQDHAARLMLPIWIGVAEAAAIASRLGGPRSSRPLTLDLLHTILARLGGRVVRLDIRGVEEGVYLADLCVRDLRGRVHRFDCRPSDGVGLALRVTAPIRVEVGALDAAQPLAEKVGRGPIVVSADDAAGRRRLLDALAELDPSELGYEM